MRRQGHGRPHLSRQFFKWLDEPQNILIELVVDRVNVSVYEAERIPITQVLELVADMICSTYQPEFVENARIK